MKFCGKRVKSKSQKDFGTNSHVRRSYMEKTGTKPKYGNIFNRNAFYKCLKYETPFQLFKGADNRFTELYRVGCHKTYSVG